MRRLLSLMAMVSVLALSTAALADLCFICRSGGSCGQYCRAPGGSDTQAARESCKKRGCEIGGTASCPTAANVKVCAAPSRSAPSRASTPAYFGF